MTFMRKLRYMFVLSGTAILCQQSIAAELTDLHWESGVEQDSLSLTLDGSFEYQTNSLDEAKRLRLVLPDSTLGAGVKDIPGLGIVKSVFPYVDENGGSVNVDLLLNEPGRLRVLETGTGLRLIATTAEDADGAESAATGSRQDAEAGAATEPEQPGGFNRIKSIRHASLPGGRVQVNVSMAWPPEQPGQFSTNQPPRLAFDFFDTRSDLDSPVTRIGVGAVESIAAVEAGDRTRLVFNLLRPVPHDSEITEDGIVFVIQNPDTESARVERTQPKPFASKSDARHEIENIDFRRSVEGGGRITVQLSDPETGIDVREQAGEIIIDFLNSEIDNDLEQRLDVVDFATPVRTIDTFQEGNTVRMVVDPTGNYQHLAYQSGNIFHINVDPVVETEEEVETDEFGYSGERLSLNFQQINVRAALQVIADFTGLNFVTSDNVSGTLTLRLKDVPWDQALDIILQTRGLGMRRSGNVVWVAPAQEIAQRERQQLESQQQKSELEPLTSELIQINYAKASDIAKILKSVQAVESGTQSSIFGSVTVSEVETESNTLLSPRGNVTVDDRTNAILIQDTPSKISQVRALIAQLDKPVRQVLIETRIVEASDDFSRSLGARLGFQRVVQQAKGLGGADVVGSGTLEGAATTSSSLSGAAGAPGFGGTPDGLSVNLPSGGAGGNPAASYAFEIFKAGTGIANLIQLEISALEAEGRGKVIANPRLITSNQKTARIEQGQERQFVSFGEVEEIKAVLSLTVTPQITPDDRVVMTVLVTQDSFVSPTEPTLNTKRIETEVLLENGETAVIGGIYQQDTSSNVSKVPFLGDIPGLGVLFRTKSRSDNRTELLIFLTPRIVNPALNLGAVDSRMRPAA